MQRLKLTCALRLPYRDCVDFNVGISLGGHEFSDLVRDRLGNLLRLLLWFPFAHDEFGRGDPRPKFAVVRLAGANTKRP